MEEIWERLNVINPVQFKELEINNNIGHNVVIWGTPKAKCVEEEMGKETWDKWKASM
jgi:hypothetical protein